MLTFITGSFSSQDTSSAFHRYETSESGRPLISGQLQGSRRLAPLSSAVGDSGLVPDYAKRRVQGIPKTHSRTSPSID